MISPLQRRLMVWLAAAVAACVCWLVLPGTATDRAAFQIVARGFANPPFFISGNGSHKSPWKLRTFAARNRPDTRQAPVIVSLGDDLEGFFQSSPPSPIDIAVVLSNFQRLGAKKAATAGVLAWDSPDPIGLAALDKAISRFDSLVMAAPLSRGAAPDPMPAAFRKASVPLDSIHGDISLLPVVNRIPIPGIILGKDNTLAGFQSIDPGKTTDFAPLLARWEDRIVFAFPLLTVLQRLDLPVDALEIRLGEYLKLGPHGSIVPIDRFGRLAMPIQRVSPYAEIPAEALIDGGDDLFPKQAPEPVVLRDDRSGAEPATREFSKNLPATIAVLASDTGLAPARDFPRLGASRELILLLLLAGVLALLCGLPVFPRNIGFLTVAAVCLVAQWIAAASAARWLPGIPALAAVFCAFGASMAIVAVPGIPKPKRIREPRVKSKPVPKPTAPPVLPITPPSPTTPAKPPAKKSAQRPKKRRR